MRSIASQDVEADRSGGFSLIEVIVATLIATVVITGLAYTFGLGRGFIDRYEIARAALAEAQGRMERLAVKNAADADLSVGPPHAGGDFIYQGHKVGGTSWTVTTVTDWGPPAAQKGLKDVTVEVWWGDDTLADTVRVNRLFPAY